MMISGGLVLGSKDPYFRKKKAKAKDFVSHLGILSSCRSIMCSVEEAKKKRI